LLEKVFVRKKLIRSRNNHRRQFLEFVTLPVKTTWRSVSGHNGIR